MTTSESKQGQGGGLQFGTFYGVFIPSILTILGVIMYLRFGWVLGQVGLAGTLGIVLLSIAITTLTGLSISAMATNMRVEGGGTYYIISRSLGAEAGAAVGLPLYFAQALGISFYIAGFAEAVVGVFPDLSFKVVAVCTLIATAAAILFAASLVVRTQLLVFGLIVASLVSFFIGGTDPTPIITAEPVTYLPFWAVFAVFFPAVTGIEAGVSMSGDLKNPAKSLPWGTLTAIGVALVIYLAIPIVMDARIENKEQLVLNGFIMKDMAAWEKAIIAGVWGATLSSAIGALFGAPRTLQALARDGIVPRFIGKGYGQGNEPHIATALTFIVALAGVLLGDLNMIAPLLSMFFLTSYGMLNLSSAFEGLIASPSWRPKFKVHWAISLTGAIGCLVVMLMINAGATILATVVIGTVFFIMTRRRMNANWGDMKYGILMLGLIHLIQKLERIKPDKRTWRPNLLVLSGPPKTHWDLIEMANRFCKRRGFLTIGTILSTPDVSVERLDSMRDTIRTYVHDNDVEALINLHPSQSFYTGLHELIRGYGFGPIVPNTIMIGDPGEDSSPEEYGGLVKLIHKRKRNLVIFREDLRPGCEGFKKLPKQCMHILWGGQKHNAGLALALSTILHKDDDWEEASLELTTLIAQEDQRADSAARLKSFIDDARIDANGQVVKFDDDGVFAAITKEVEKSHLVFLGLRAPTEEESDAEYGEYLLQLMEKTKGMPDTLYVLASEDIEFYQLFQRS